MSESGKSLTQNTKISHEINDRIQRLYLKINLYPLF